MSKVKSLKRAKPGKVDGPQLKKEGELMFVKPVGVDKVPALLQEGEIVIPVKHAKKVAEFLKEENIKLPNLKKGGRVKKQKQTQKQTVVQKVSVRIGDVAPKRKRAPHKPRAAAPAKSWIPQQHYTSYVVTKYDDPTKGRLITPAQPTMVPAAQQPVVTGAPVVANVSVPAPAQQAQQATIVNQGVDQQARVFSGKKYMPSQSEIMKRIQEDRLRRERAERAMRQPESAPMTDIDFPAPRRRPPPEEEEKTAVPPGPGLFRSNTSGGAGVPKNIFEKVVETAPAAAAAAAAPMPEPVPTPKLVAQPSREENWRILSGAVKRYWDNPKRKPTVRYLLTFPEESLQMFANEYNIEVKADTKKELAQGLSDYWDVIYGQE